MAGCLCSLLSSGHYYLFSGTPFPIRYHFHPLGVAAVLLGTVATTGMGNYDSGKLPCAKALWHSMGERAPLLCVLHLVIGYHDYGAVAQHLTRWPVK